MKTFDKDNAIKLSSKILKKMRNMPAGSITQQDITNWNNKTSNIDSLTSQEVDDLLDAAETAENEETAPVAFNSDFANFIIAAIKADIIENVIEISTNVTSTCTITGAANNGHCQTIIYRNITETVENPDYDENDPTSEQYLSEETDLYVSIPSNFVTPGGTQIVLLCPIGGYCEVSYLNVNGTIYARGL